MKNILVVTLFSLLSTFTLNAQAYATNFIADDCSGTSCKLFDELDNGKVVVIAWTMPCFGCIGPCIAANDAVSSFSVSNPGEVVFYLVDDYANTDCGSLEGWGNTYNMSAETRYFSNAAVSMSDYGTDGMPKVAVIGCAYTHKIFFNQNSSPSYGDIQAAIGEALSGNDCALGIDDVDQNDLLNMTVFPNPTTDVVNVSYYLTTSTSTTVELFSLTGALVKTISVSVQDVGDHTQSFSTNGIVEGVYLLKITTDVGIETKRLTVSK